MRNSVLIIIKSKERTHGISVESLAGPISDLVVKPVALEKKFTKLMNNA